MTKSDGSLWGTERFNTHAEANAWLAREKAKYYYPKNNSEKISGSENPPPTSEAVLQAIRQQAKDAADAKAALIKGQIANWDKLTPVEQRETLKKMTE